MAGEYAELSFQNELEYRERIPIKSNKRISELDGELWITKDNRMLNLSDMTTSHLQYSLAKCKRDNWRTFHIPYLEKELQRRTNYI